MCQTTSAYDFFHGIFMIVIITINLILIIKHPSTEIYDHK